jgi:hypothetical protein
MTTDDRAIYDQWRGDLERLNDAAALAAASADPDRCREVADRLDAFAARRGPRTPRFLDLRARASAMRREVLRVGVSGAVDRLDARSDDLRAAAAAMTRAAADKADQSAILALEAILTTAERTLAAIRAVQRPAEQPGPHGAD